ncbi:TonB-dependent receptor [Sphingobium sp. H33]|uniref:TonB-dependent receptor n=2 Tax=Sphingobium nicotianae TaxID=2782607 RepID=A0A9X1IQN4_9SPHN|nr:TonB-dependent receptor [Sphingobium nicotianae]
MALAQPAMAQAQDAQGTDASNAIIVIGKYETSLTTGATTGSRLGLTPLETPATVNVMDGDALRARGDFSIMDAVTRAPGVTNAGNPGNGGSALAMRGFSGQGSVLQLYDGLRLFPVADTITFPSDPWNVERIEVLSGPASVLYGQGALGGAVNIIPRQPNTQRLEAQGEAGYGSQNSWHVAAGAAGPLGEMLSFRADASYRRSDGYVDRGDSETLALSGALRFQPHDDVSLTLRDDYGDLHPTKYFGTPLIHSTLDTSIRERNYNVADAVMHWRDNRLALTLNWAVSDAITIANSAYYLTSKRKWRNLETYCWIGADGDCPNGIGYGTPGNIYRADNFGIVHDQKQYGDQGSIKISAPIGGHGKNDLLLGFDVSRVNLVYSHDFGSDYQEDEVNPKSFNPGLFLDTQGIAPRYHTTTDTYALYVEDRLAVTEQFSLVGGLRYEHNKVGRWNYVYNGAGTQITGEAPALNGGQDAYKSLDHATWRVGAVYQPTPSISLYGQYATAVDPLGTLTTYSASATQFQLTNATGNQIEMGAKAVFLDGHGSAAIAAYRIAKHNLFTQTRTNGAIEQVGERSSRGIEASLSLALPGGFGLEANGTLLDARFDSFSGNDGNTPPGVPEEAANVELRWSAADRFQARADLRYVGRRFSDNANRFRVPAYTVVDLSVTYAVTPNIGLDVRIYNLFDKDYALGTYSDEQWILGRPRSVDISIRARY